MTSGKNYNYLPDAIVVEGPKAGGHLGFKKEQIQDQHYALEALIPEVVMIASSYKEQKQIPVIAAGGISTGEDIAHFMELGASGVQMGSIFVTTLECDASRNIQRSIYSFQVRRCSYYRKSCRDAGKGY